MPGAESGALVALRLLRDAPALPGVPAPLAARLARLATEATELRAALLAWGDTQAAEWGVLSAAEALGVSERTWHRERGR